MFFGPDPQREAFRSDNAIQLSETDEGETLEDAAAREREYLKGKLRDDLGREPTDEELNEWLRQHTEGY